MFNHFETENHGVQGTDRSCQTGWNGDECSKIGKQTSQSLGLNCQTVIGFKDDLIVSRSGKPTWAALGWVPFRFGIFGADYSQSMGRSLMNPRFFRGTINQRKSIETQGLATSGGASGASGTSGAAEISGGGSPMGGFASGAKPMGTLAGRFLTKSCVCCWPKLFGVVMTSATCQPNLRWSWRVICLDWIFEDLGMLKYIVMNVSKLKWLMWLSSATDGNMSCQVRSCPKPGATECNWWCFVIFFGNSNSLIFREKLLGFLCSFDFFAVPFSCLTSQSFATHLWNPVFSLTWPCRRSSPGGSGNDSCNWSLGWLKGSYSGQDL